LNQVIITSKYSPSEITGLSSFDFDERSNRRGEESEFIDYLRFIQASSKTREGLNNSGYLGYRRSFYTRLVSDPMIIPLLEQVGAGRATFACFESFCRLGFELSDESAPFVVPADQQIIWLLTFGDYYQKADLYTTIMDLDEFDINDLPRRIAATEVGAEAALVMAHDATSGTFENEEYDYFVAAALKLTLNFVEKSAIFLGNNIYSDEFRGLVKSQFRYIASSVDLPSSANTEMSIVDQFHRFSQTCRREYLPIFIDAVRHLAITDTVDEYDVSNDSDTDDYFERDLESEQNQGQSQEGDELIWVPDLSGVIKPNTQQSVIDAGQTILDFLRNLQIQGELEEIEIGLGEFGSSDFDSDSDEQEAEKKPYELYFEVYVNFQQKKQMKAVQVIAAIKHGQSIVFTSRAHLKNFNNATNNRYANNVSVGIKPLKMDRVPSDSSKLQKNIIEAQYDDKLREKSENNDDVKDRIKDDKRAVGLTQPDTLQDIERRLSEERRLQRLEERRHARTSNRRQSNQSRHERQIHRELRRASRIEEVLRQLERAAKEKEEASKMARDDEDDRGIGTLQRIANRVLGRTAVDNRAELQESQGKQIPQEKDRDKESQDREQENRQRETATRARRSARQAREQLRKLMRETEQRLSASRDRPVSNRSERSVEGNAARKIEFSDVTEVKSQFNRVEETIKQIERQKNLTK
jgi:hypothetical protein